MRKGILIILCLSIFFLVGCWDKVEVDQRAFVSSMGIDLNDKDKMNRFIVTYEYPNINAIGKNATEDTKTFVVSTPSSSIFQAGRQFTTSVAFPFYYKHAKVVVLGEDLANEGKLVREIIDELNRDTKINKKIQILVSEGKAIDILRANIKQDQTTDGIIYTALKGTNNASRFIPQTLVEMIKDADYSGVTLVPKIAKRGKEVVISGGCVMKDYQHIAWIGEKESRSLSLINGKTKSDTIDVPYKDSIVSYAITDVSSTKDVRIDEEIIVDIPIKIEGYLQGYIEGDDRTVYDDEVLKDMEKVIEKFMKKEIERTLKLIQDEYNADLIGIGEDLSKFHHRKWNKIKDRWDEIFPEVKFNVSIDAKIRRTGLIK